jgi:chemotaxis response regulator CheB
MKQNGNSSNVLDRESGLLANARYMRKAVPVVCLGLSSGGIEPLRTIMRHLKPRTGLAFVVISHVSRTQPSELPWLLAQWTRMPATVARNGLMLQPNHIYVIPPGQEISLSDGFFRVQPRSRLRGWSNVITVFLESLATSQKHPGIAVILSGLDADGAAALKVFREKGGITIAQDLRSAEHHEMPTAAIATGCVDFVLRPEAIARKLETIAKDYWTNGLAVAGGK